MPVLWKDCSFEPRHSSTLNYVTVHLIVPTAAYFSTIVCLRKWMCGSRQMTTHTYLKPLVTKSSHLWTLYHKINQTLSSLSSYQKWLLLLNGRWWSSLFWQICSFNIYIYILLFFNDHLYMQYKVIYWDCITDLKVLLLHHSSYLWFLTVVCKCSIAALTSNSEQRDYLLSPQCCLSGVSQLETVATTDVGVLTSHKKTT